MAFALQLACGQGDIMPTRLVASSLVAVLAIACGSKDKQDKETPKADPPKTTEPKPAAKPEAPKPAASSIAIDPEIAKRVNDIVTNCKVDEKTFYIADCKGDEEYAITNYAASKEVVGVYESLAEMALTTGAKDKKVFGAIVATWNVFNNRALQAKASTPAAAERVLKLYPLVPSSIDRFGYAAAIPLAAGKREELVAMLGKLPDGPLKARSVLYMLDYGGVAALPDVQAIAKSTTDDAARFNATWAVGVALRPSVTDADRTKMCDWVKEVASDPAANPRLAAGALDSLGRCSGPYIDAALTAIEARVAANKLTEPTANALHHMCWAEGMVGGTPNGTPEQCTRVMQILEKGVKDKDIPADGARMGTMAIEFVSKNAGQVAKGKALLGQLSSSKNADVAKYAKESLARLK
jgi:hypothetical protein